MNLNKFSNSAYSLASKAARIKLITKFVIGIGNRRKVNNMFYTQNISSFTSKDDATLDYTNQSEIVTKNEKIQDIKTVSVEEKKKFTDYFSNEYETISSHQNKEKEMIHNKINETLFNKIFNTQKTNQLKDEKQNQTQSDIIKFDKSKDILDSSKTFISTIDRTIDAKQNKEFTQLIIENKLDLSNDKLTIKSLNMKDRQSQTETKQEQELYEIDLGKIKSFPNINLDNSLSEDNVKILSQNSQYEYEVSLLGKGIKDDDNELNLNQYVALNEDGRHFISPVIFHEDPNAKKDSIGEKETIFSYMLKNPFVLFIFIIVGYFIYPNLWKKDYFMALSEDFNHLRHLEDKGSYKTYDYINYRRGLYASVRSNFS